MGAFALSSHATFQPGKLGKFVENRSYLGLENRQVDPNRVPDLHQVDPEILVHEDVSHTNDIGPGNIRMLIPQRI